MPGNLCHNNLHDVTVEGARRPDGRCRACFRAKRKRVQSKYEHTYKGAATLRRWRATPAGRRAQFYAILRRTAATHATAQENLNVNLRQD
jgi:hypothetical protein